MNLLQTRHQLQSWSTVFHSLSHNWSPGVVFSCCDCTQNTQEPDQQHGPVREASPASVRPLLGCSSSMCLPISTPHDHAVSVLLCAALTHRLGSLLQHSLQEAVQGSSSFRSFSQVCGVWVHSWHAAS
jgi:hypothetical protein